MFLGRCQLGLGRAADAVVSLQRALEMVKTSGAATSSGTRSTISLATALRDSGRAAEAEREFAEAQRLSVERVETEREQLSRYLDWHAGRAQAPGTVPPGAAGVETPDRGRTGRSRGQNRRRSRPGRTSISASCMRKRAGSHAPPSSSKRRPRSIAHSRRSSTRSASPTSTPSSTRRRFRRSAPPSCSSRATRTSTPHAGAGGAQQR